MKKILYLGLSALMVLGSLTACSASKKEGNSTKVDANVKADIVKESEKPLEEVKLTFAVNVQPQLPIEFWKIPVEKYMAIHPNVKIELISQPTSSVTLWEYLKVLRATGKFPDMFVTNSVSDLGAAGALLELSAEDLDFIKNPDVGNYEGKYYLYPYKKMLNGVFYNKEIFSKLGISEPKNFEELIFICETIKTNSYIPMALGAKDGWMNGVVFSQIATAFLGEKNPMWTRDLNAGKVKFDSPEFKEVAENFVTLTQNYMAPSLMSVSYAQSLESFFTGKSAMIPIGSWLLGEELNAKPNFEIGFFPMPGKESNDILATYENEGLAISADSPNAEIAKDFFRFFLADEEWYGEFLKTEQLFATTKEPVSYEMSQTRKGVEERIKALKELQSWDSATGDNAHLPGMEGYFSKFCANIMSGADIAEEIVNIDKEWKIAKSNQ